MASANLAWMVLGNEVLSVEDLGDLGAQIRGEATPVLHLLELVGGAPHHRRWHVQPTKAIRDLHGVTGSQRPHLAPERGAAARMGVPGPVGFEGLSGAGALVMTR
jgi:hypothetical protein